MTRVWLTTDSADPSLPLQVTADDAETITGTRNDLAVTPASLRAFMSSIEFYVDLYPGADDDAKFAAALADWDAHAGGGTIVFGGRNYSMSDQWAIPNDGASPQPNQKSLVIRGSGAANRGNTGAPVGGTIIDFTFTGSPAKIDTRGHGEICIEDITFTDSSGGSTPFFQTTNTTPIIERCMFYGSKSGTACDQDAIVLGGGTRDYDGTATSKFDGYKPIIRDNHFSKIRRAVWLRPGCNDGIIEANTIWISCGAPSNAYGAIDLIGDVAGAIVGNVIANNTIEVANYANAIRCGPYAKANAFICNGLFDPTGTTTRGIYFDDNATYNLVVAGYSDETFTHYVEHAGSAKTNTFITAHQSQYTNHAQPVNFLSNIGTGGLRAEGTVVLAGGTGAGGGTIIQPAIDQTEGSALLLIKRSAADDVAPGQAVWSLKQNGDITITDSAGATVVWSAGGKTMTTTGAVQITTNASNISMRGAALRLLEAAGGTEIVRMRASPASSTRGAVQFNSTGAIVCPTAANPESALTAPVGSIATRDDGAVATTPTLYVKETGAGSTGWTPMISAHQRIVAVKTGNYTLAATDDVVIYNGSSITATLPTAVGFTGRIHVIKNIHSTALTIATTSSQTIDGAAPGTLAQWGVLRVMSDGTNWLTI